MSRPGSTLTWNVILYDVYSSLSNAVDFVKGMTLPVHVKTIFIT